MRNSIADHIEGARQVGDVQRGKCPRCEANREPFIIYSDGEVEAFSCHGCGWTGDAIDFFREELDISFPDACAMAGVPDRAERKGAGKRAGPAARKPRDKRGKVVGIPPQAWQEKAYAFAHDCERVLWSDEGARALAWLRARGFTDQAIRVASLGYNPRYRRAEPGAWGLDPSKHPKGVHLAPGIIFPHCGELKPGEAAIWKINVRRIDDHPSYPKYQAVTGSKNDALYNCDAVKPGEAGPADVVVLVEGELNALSLMQEHILCVGTGSARSAQRLKWVSRLQAVGLVLVALDADKGGEDGAEWWLNRLRNSIRWKATYGDQNDMLKAGDSLRDWVKRGIKHAHKPFSRRLDLHLPYDEPAPGRENGAGARV